MKNTNQIKSIDYLNRALALFPTILPKPIEVTEEDEARIRIPGWRYIEMEEAILEMYRELDLRTIPIDSFHVAVGIGCPPIPYRLFGPKVLPILKKASLDGLTLHLFGAPHPFILFNDRQPPSRIVFSLMHEVGHVRLGHKEHSKLAEMEANYFAAVSVCPVPLLDRLGIEKPDAVSRVFGISEECARFRLKKLAEWRALAPNERNLSFGSEVLNRFRLKIPVQPLLFEGKGIG